jgi:hypothetical protein
MFGFVLGLGAGYLVWGAPRRALEENPKNPRRVAAGRRQAPRMIRSAQGKYLGGRRAA